MIHGILQFFSTKLAEIQVDQPNTFPTIMIDLLSGFDESPKWNTESMDNLPVPWYNIYLLALSICCIIIVTEYLILSFINHTRTNLIQDRRMIGRYRYNCEGESLDGHRCKRRLKYSTKCSQHRVE